MKYQCLECGEVLSEKKEKCPECSSIKLISIEEILNESEREELLRSTNKEITLLIQDVFVREETDEENTEEVPDEDDIDDYDEDEEWEGGIKTVKDGIYELNLDNLLRSSEKEKSHSLFGKKKKET